MKNQVNQFETLFSETIQEKIGLFRSIAGKIVDSADEADDAVQTALMKAWRTRFRFRNTPESLSGWVAKIVVTESYDLLRRKIRERRKLLEHQPETYEGNPALELLDKAIEKLPDLYRETIHIAVLNNIGKQEAAAILGCSANTLYQRIHKAKALLRERMRGMGNE